MPNPPTPPIGKRSFILPRLLAVDYGYVFVMSFAKSHDHVRIVCDVMAVQANILASRKHATNIVGSTAKPRHRGSLLKPQRKILAQPSSALLGVQGVAISNLTPLAAQNRPSARQTR